MEQNDKSRLKLYLTDYLDGLGMGKDRAGKYICPICHSGTGKNGTSAFSLTNNNTTWHCFVCDKGGDVFDLYREVNGCTADAAFQGIEDMFGSYAAPRRTASRKPQKKTDYTEYFRKCHARIGKCNYLKERGITSQEVIDRFNLGYDEAWKHPDLEQPDKVPASPRLIIPTSPYSYTARDVRKDIPARAQRYKKQKAGSAPVFNGDALTTAAQPIFIVEGELDAMGIIQEGGEAVALGSTSNKGKLLDAVRATPPSQPLILFLDNDTEGDICKAALYSGLEALNLPVCIASGLLPVKGKEGGLDAPAAAKWGIYGDFEQWRGKDPGDMLVEDEAAFRKLIAALAEQAATDAPREAEKRMEAMREDFMGNTAASHITDFLDGISASASREATATGYPLLDAALDGGLYEGLYVIGAMSSLGKTSYTLQAADAIAEGGTDVLIFSLEMARAELMAKSISRNTAVLQEAMGLPAGTAKTTRQILTGSKYRYYSQEERELIQKAVTMYQAGAAEHIYIFEGIGDISTAQIRETVQRYFDLFPGRKPVIIVDYLQLLAPYSDHATDKQATDHSVLDLKRISRDFCIPVVAISSFNRTATQSKTQTPKVAEENFKESGAIEYSADVLIGMNFQKAEKAASADAVDMAKEGEADLAKVQVVIIKNRNGRRNMRINYDYYKPFNYFKEADEQPPRTKQGTGASPTGKGKATPRHPALEELDDDEDMPF